MSSNKYFRIFIHNQTWTTSGTGNGKRRILFLNFGLLTKKFLKCHGRITNTSYSARTLSSSSIGIQVPGVNDPCLSVLISPTTRISSGVTCHVWSVTLPLVLAPRAAIFKPSSFKSQIKFQNSS